MSYTTRLSSSGRLDKSGTVYYLVLFRTENDEQPVAIISRRPFEQVTAEKTLSYSITRSGRAKDIRNAKAALSEALRRHFP